MVSLNMLIEFDDAFDAGRSAGVAGLHSVHRLESSRDE